ncbi:hypothetical protein PMAYCL1PPCAC_16006, partial [Pristionchus mayeri]
LSRLPDLCLLEIFMNLKIMDICSITTANRRICSICSDKTLDKAKWKGAYLSLFQIENGYSFYYEPCPGGLKEPIYVYHYQIAY